MLLVVARPDGARRMHEELVAWSPFPGRVLLFPEPDALPYERISPDPETTSERTSVLTGLVTGSAGEASSPLLIVASVRSLMDHLLPVTEFRDRLSTLRVGDEVSPHRLIERWLEAGYEPAPVVDRLGQFARRGGILDVFPCAAKPDSSDEGQPVSREAPPLLPVRIEFWGDRVESLRVFDPTTQRSVYRVEEVLVPPVSLVATVQSGSRHWPQPSSLIDYLPPGSLIVLHEPSRLAAVAADLDAQSQELAADLRKRGELEEDAPRPYFLWDELVADIESSVRDGPADDSISTDGAAPRHCPSQHPGRNLMLVLEHHPDDESMAFIHPPAFGGRLQHFLDAVLTREGMGQQVVIVTQQAPRMNELLEERGLAVPNIQIVQGSLQEGWASTDVGVTIFTDNEVFGFTRTRRVVRHRRFASRDRFLADIQPGDYVVHVDHGIGIYQGMVRLPVTGRAEAVAETAGPSDGGQREYLAITYAEGDLLYVPVDQSDQVARYVAPGDHRPNLTRLGTGDWAKARRRVRRAVREIAKDLLELYAARQTAQGHSFAPDSQWQWELEHSFPYLETPDQLQAIQEVKADMESPRPMDRLLVGDVGFGKTEIALRAAFKAVMDGRQVAVLVPTTVLAQQHFNTFKQRLSAFPVRVEMLSRFLSEREQQEVIRGLKDGRVDICIGTHRLIQKDVQFKDLGLVIIDEEQRFGVAHKERLKQLRKEVDVLTMTATPIPRTLYMSLAGVRDMSTVETPPEDRLPVRTYVMQYHEETIREAILRELDRGGQVYFVHNRVRGIDVVADRVRRLVPEARVAIGHGQMPEDLLERVMLDFSLGRYDVLVCTTIIESGIDIPNVNTIIVNNAHRFGLAQLYQLRGRVGRGSQRAYAYLFYPPDAALTEQAEQRLRTIFEATELGAGFRIAMKDLEIRGAGNLLGAEQHGHISAVGFDLYTRLLAEAVDQMRSLVQGAPMDGGAAPSARPRVRHMDLRTIVDLPLPAHIPSDYIEDDALRLNIYQRLAAIRTGEELGALMDELEDRFGPLPEPVQDLVYVVGLRLKAAARGVDEIAMAEDDVTVKLSGRLPRLDWRGLARKIGSPLRVGSNQVRLPARSGQSWMASLLELVEALPETGTSP